MSDRDEQRRLMREAECQVVPAPVYLDDPSRPPVPCDPAVEAVPESFSSPSAADIAAGPVLPTPTSILVNPPTVVACDEGMYGTIDGVVVPPGYAWLAALELTAVFYWTSVGSLSLSQLESLAARTDLDTWTETELAGSIVTLVKSESELSAGLGLTADQAQDVTAAVEDAVQELVAEAEALTLSLLDCHWRNNEQPYTCPGLGGTETVEAGELRGASQAEVDAEALSLAQSLLDCRFGNVATTRTCVNIDIAWSDMPESVVEYVYGEGSAEVVLATFVGIHTVVKDTFEAATQEEADTMAADFALSQLQCFYTAADSDACYDPGVCDPRDADPFTGEPGSIVEVPAGLIQNYESQVAATQDVAEMLASLLECVYCNREVIRTCDDEFGATVRLFDGTYIPVAWTGNSTSFVENSILVSGIRVEAGTVFSDESEDDATAQAVILALSQLVCDSCNVCVPPLCQSDYVYPAEDSDLCYVNPADWPTLELQTSYGHVLDNEHNEAAANAAIWWSLNATLGVPAGTFCGQNDPQGTQDAASAVGVIPWSQVDPASQQSDPDGTCRFGNDAMSLSCMDVILEADGSVSEDVHYLSPRSTSQFNMAAEMVVITADDVPIGWTPLGVVVDGAVDHPEIYKAWVAKQYANYLAKLLARSMMNCLWENPPGTAYCDVSYSANGGSYYPAGADAELATALYDKYQAGVGDGELLFKGYSLLFKGRPVLFKGAPDAESSVSLGDLDRESVFGQTWQVNAMSKGGIGDPVILQWGTVSSAESYADMKALLFGYIQSALDCWWGNAEMTVLCGASTAALMGDYSIPLPDNLVESRLIFGDGAIGTDPPDDYNVPLVTGWESISNLPAGWPLTLYAGVLVIDGPYEESFRDEVSATASGSATNPILIQADLFRSSDSPYYANLDALQAGMGLLDCYVDNDLKTAECPDTCKEGLVDITNDYVPSTPSVVELPENTVRSYVSKYAANLEALTTAHSLLQCLAYNEEQTPDDCPSGEVMMGGAIIAGQSLTATSTCEANALALSMANSLRTCSSADALDEFTTPFKVTYGGGGGGGGAKAKVRAGGILYDYDGVTVLKEFGETAEEDVAGDDPVIFILHVVIEGDTKEYSHSSIVAYTGQDSEADVWYTKDDGELYIIPYGPLHIYDKGPPEAYEVEHGKQTYFNVVLGSASAKGSDGLDMDGPGGRKLASFEQNVTTHLCMREIVDENTNLLLVTAMSNAMPRISLTPGKAFAVRCIFPWGHEAGTDANAKLIRKYLVRVNVGYVIDKSYAADTGFVAKTRHRPQAITPVGDEAGPVGIPGDDGLQTYWDVVMHSNKVAGAIKNETLEILINVDEYGRIENLPTRSYGVEINVVDTLGVTQYHVPAVINSDDETDGSGGLYFVSLFKLVSDGSVSEPLWSTEGISATYTWTGDIIWGTDLWVGENLEGHSSETTYKILRQFNKTTKRFEFRTLLPGPGVSMTQTEDTIEISAEAGDGGSHGGPFHAYLTGSASVMIATGAVITNVATGTDAYPNGVGDPPPWGPYDIPEGNVVYLEFTIKSDLTIDGDPTIISDALGWPVGITFSGDVQTKARVVIGMAIAGTLPEGVDGFQVIEGAGAYYFQQFLQTNLFMALMAVDGKACVFPLAFAG